MTWDFYSHFLSTVMHIREDCLAATKDRSALFILTIKYNNIDRDCQRA